ncbi:hypothetical protein [Mucilaginibacter myungsuensis]|uniref:Outer membrane beta-barrel porin/alpha-amylase n=1 Tax=Mucilaginibacter myungsuensis TaxID=649104 RepID=A0A929PY73_9SPHI|nr:hypothetical protein [Mucilaginibacter myungsuensis]MBE9663936.1 hypothetical protein [Mucilaginibacter myungsuensis]MDN3598348.1 hypothetical protein [Mucilaginibacter myungsuensis]
MLLNRTFSTIAMIICGSLLSSCFTLLQERNKVTTIHTTRPATVTIGNTSKKTKKNRAEFTLVKDSVPLPVTAVLDTGQRTVTVKPKNALTYYTDMAMFGTGILVRHHPKRYTYPGNVYITTDTVFNHKPFRNAKKGDLLLHVSLPYVNTFSMVPANEPRKNSIGFLGFSMGLDKYYSKNRFISLTAGGALDFALPFPAPYDRLGTYDDMRSVWLGATNNHVLGRFTLGYGLSYSKNIWIYTSDVTGIPANPDRQTTMVNYAGGLLFNSYWRLSNAFNVGAIYRPSFVGFGNNTSTYEHLISLDVAWKIHLKK